MEAASPRSEIPPVGECRGIHRQLLNDVRPTDPVRLMYTVCARTSNSVLRVLSFSISRSYSLAKMGFKFVLL